MTRKEEIIQAAEEMYSGLGNRVVFQRGAEWADQTMIEKAVKWLEENAFEYAETYGIHADGFKTYKGFDTKALLEDFRKSIEE